MEPIPDGFSGLIYPPAEENGVYLLMGLLWNYLPYRFAFEKFEVDPRLQGYDHKKWFDAKGKCHCKGKWKNVTVEFKVLSSGLFKDIQENPTLYCDFLVCWRHDAAKAVLKGHVGKVLCLEEVFNQLPPETRRMIILEPHGRTKIDRSVTDLPQLLSHFSQENRVKVQTLIELWKDVVPGKTEICFRKNGRAALRANSFSNGCLVVGDSETFTVSPTAREQLIKRFGASEQKRSLKILLSRIKLSDLPRLVRIIRGGLV
jgi:hypothetical protein